MATCSTPRAARCCASPPRSGACSTSAPARAVLRSSPPGAFRGRKVDAVEISEDALSLARQNVAAHGLKKRIRLLHGDLFEPVRDARYDLIIANPPYVDAAGMKNFRRNAATSRAWRSPAAPTGWR